MSDYITTAIVVIAVGIQIYGAIGLTLCVITLRRALRELECLNDDGSSPPPPKPPMIKLPRLSRRMPEPEPGGTKVYQTEAWDEGLERTDV